LLNPLVAAIYNNLGNVELAVGNLEESTDYFTRAIPIWKAGGDETATHLALTYLCMGRVHMFKGEFNEAMKLTSQADALFVRTIGADKGFMLKYIPTIHKSRPLSDYYS
jgi:tetratricopeptide (TPR) repeat protein